MCRIDFYGFLRSVFFITFVNSAHSNLSWYKMRLSERHQRILDLLKTNGMVSVNNLGKELNVSAVTIRKDLAVLEENKLLFRAHGGAIRMDPYIANRNVLEKEKLFPEEKKRIGQEAARLLIPNDAIIIASGTTVLAFARCIDPGLSLTVLTSAMNVAMALLKGPEIEVVQLGGLVRHTSTSVVGNYVEKMLENFSSTKLFLGVDGFDPEYGLTTTNALEASVNRAMIKASQKIIVLTDSSKFGRRGFGRICGVEVVDQVITDSGVSPEIVRQLEDLGVKVSVV